MQLFPTLAPHLTQGPTLRCLHEQLSAVLLMCPLGLMREAGQATLLRQFSPRRSPNSSKDTILLTIYSILQSSKFIKSHLSK